MACVLYESNLLGAKGPRKMRVLVPDVSEDNKVVQWKPKGINDGMQLPYKQGNTKGMKVLYNKPPKWNEGKS